MPPDLDLYRSLGRIEEGIDSLKNRFDALKVTTRELGDRLVALEGDKQRTKGALTVIAALASVAGASVSAVVSHFWK